VTGLGKHVERLEDIETVAAIGQAPDVPGLRRGIAGDVDNPLRMQCGHPFQHPVAATITGRIKNDDLRLDTAHYKFSP
jgi:hypothetical protein